MDNKEWIKETIPLRDSILNKRVYRNEEITHKHISKVTQESGVVLVFKFRNHFPSFHEVRTFLSLLEESIEEAKAGILDNKQIKSYLVRILYGDWIIEVATMIQAGIIAGIIANAIWEKIRSRGEESIIEEIEEFEEYYPDGRVIRWRRRRRYRR